MNKHNNFRKKVAVLNIEGLSTSTKRENSPLLPSNSKNIEELGRLYQRKILKTASGLSNDELLETDPVSLYNSFSSSRRTKSPELNYFTDNNSLVESLNQQIINLKKHTFAIHIFSVLSKDRKLFSEEIFDTIIMKAKSLKIGKVYLHLFCDFGIKESEAKKFVDKFNSIDGKTFQVSTISGIGTLLGDKHKTQVGLYKTIAFGEGRQIIDITHIGDGDFGHLLPHKFISRGYPIGLIRDFDRMIYMNNSPEIFMELAYNLNKRTKLFRGDKNFFNLANISLKRTYKKIAGKEPKNLLQSDLCQENLFTTISKYGLSQVKILEKDNREQYLEGFNGSNKMCEEEELVLVDGDGGCAMTASYIMENMCELIDQNRHDLVFASINGLLKTSFNLDFESSIKVIDEINMQIPRLVDLCKRKEINLVISSPFGGCDRFPNSVKSGQTVNFDNIKLTNVPLIIINRALKKADKNQFIIGNSNIIDIISSKDTIYDFAPTILELFNIDKPESFEGRSLINV